MKTSMIFFTIVLIAHIACAARIIRDAPEVPDKNFTMEDLNKFVDNLYTSIKTEVEKVATKENLDKVQEVVKGAVQSAQKGLEDLRAKADEAMKSASTSSS